MLKRKLLSQVSLHIDGVLNSRFPPAGHLALLLLGERAVPRSVVSSEDCGGTVRLGQLLAGVLGAVQLRDGLIRTKLLLSSEAYAMC